MFETYRMLGAEREAELLREAERLQRRGVPTSRGRLARVTAAAEWLLAALRGSVVAALGGFRLG